MRVVASLCEVSARATWLPPVRCRASNLSVILYGCDLLRVLQALRQAENAPEARDGSMVCGSMFESESSRGRGTRPVYCSHVLEHLSRRDFDRAVRETFRILKPGGIFRLVVPDLEAAARTYLSALDNGEAGSNDAFMRATALGVESRRRGLRGLATAMLGNSSHLWMWVALNRARSPHKWLCEHT
jgi:SAM-dependent methyltransferase